MAVTAGNAVRSGAIVIQTQTIQTHTPQTQTPIFLPAKLGRPLLYRQTGFLLRLLGALTTNRAKLWVSGFGPWDGIVVLLVNPASTKCETRT